jgi:hypothetical protein
MNYKFLNLIIRHVIIKITAIKIMAMAGYAPGLKTGNDLRWP